MSRTFNSIPIFVCCQDRNLLGLQSRLLGLHMLGFGILWSLLEILENGSTPHATGVYDVDSVGLLRMVTAFNRGSIHRVSRSPLKPHSSVVQALNPLH